MISLLLQRLPSDAHRTHGDLYIDGAHECVTLEDVVRTDPNPDTPQNEGKVYGETAIPAGRYRVTMENSPRFGPGTLTINDVPGFDGVRIHGGNTEGDTHGCPLVGQIRAEASILRSKAALDALKSKVAAALMGDGEVWIEIKDAA